MNQLNNVLNENKVATGNPEFDSLFIVTTNNRQKALHVLDEHLINDFIANRTQFDASGFTFDDSCLQFEEHVRLKGQGQIDRYHEMLLFMVHIVQIIKIAEQRISG